MELKNYFSPHINLGDGIRAFFNEIIGIEINTPTTQPLSVKDFVSDKQEISQDIESLFFAGRLSQKTFDTGSDNISFDEAEKYLEEGKYKTILIFGVELNVDNPTRTKLSRITRLLNIRSKGAPVVVIFRYNNQIAYANIERMNYKQVWREGEKTGKVSILRNIEIFNSHTGHIKILSELRIPKSGKSKVDTFEKLYKYWQEVFNVNLLNKKFYQELSNWYFWAIQHVTFPGEPKAEDAHIKKGSLDDLIQEHRATNVIRLLTRLLFVWFIKEKKLIPEELFDLDTLQKEILHELSPFHEIGMFKEPNKESIYYKAILQNLFFATLNCPIKPDGLDKRTRDFRRDRNYGDDFGNDWLYRYKKHFKNPDKFLQLMNSVVPFLNGGLFECLDEKHKKIYVDGFSDNMTKGEKLIVPDYLFFGVAKEADLSDTVGINNKKYKHAAVKGLINILKSYKFTITENTPIEEDVALDPELLGKVFENLLASYNPETKKNARQQTGSFYTPREIVNYMVDESLIAYLKNAIADWGGMDDVSLDKELHVLTSFDSKVPFAENPELQREIVTALSTCTILDPACGSGAFPMGVLQKMVHILQKLDPDNNVWRAVQEEKAKKEAEEAFDIDDKETRNERLNEISEAFDQGINDPDYARKLFLIENCIFGIDIQPIAVQISKLRFFISLVVEQKPSDNPENNFNIRPLPNLETKFVAANTLIGIKKDGGLFETDEVKKLENELKIVRHKIFSLKSKERKIAWREKDKELRENLSSVLKNQGLPLDAAKNLAKWDPYDQNASSQFFNSEWMFGIKRGFSIVIGNPPYINTKSGIQAESKEYYKSEYDTATGQFDLFSLFIEQSLRHTKILSFIIPKPLINNENYEVVRKLLLKNGLQSIVTGSHIFENAGVESTIFITNPLALTTKVEHFSIAYGFRYLFTVNPEKFKKLPFTIINSLLSPDEYLIVDLIQANSSELGSIISILRGVEAGRSDDSINSDNTGYPILRGEDLYAFQVKDSGLWIDADFKNPKKFKTKELYSSPKLCIRRVGNKVTAAIDVGNCVSLNTIYNCHLKSQAKSGYYGLAAILNSTLINYWFYKVFILDDALFPYQRVSQLVKIPITRYFTNSNLNLLSSLMHERYDSVIKRIIDSYIFSLYLSDHMKERGIDVLEFVERDIDEVIPGRDFEKLRDTEKEQIIETLHAKWSYPNNEVVKRIGMFKEKSPDILKVIMES